MYTALLALALAADPVAAPKGALVAVGGGGTTPTIRNRTLELAGGKKAKVVVIPQASSQSDGSSSAAAWRELGCTEISILNPKEPAAALKMVQEANLIWFPGGDQVRLMDAIKPIGLPEAIRQRHRDGAVISGTSAGLAVMSEVMITGDGYKLDQIRRGQTHTAPGLALTTRTILDQHFVKRQRFNRLLSLVLDKPELVGVGVDEATAVVLKGSTIEAVGASQVLIVDARKATVKPGKPDDHSAATGIQLHVLTEGMIFDLDKK